MNINHLIDLNLSENGIPPRLSMPQGDTNSRTVVATLWGGSQPYTERVHGLTNESEVRL